MQPTTSSARTGTALDEYKHLGEDLRHYGILRLARLTLLLGTTGAMVTALASDAVRAHPIVFMLLKVGGLVIAVVFAIMDYRSGMHWLRLQQRSNQLAAVLGFEPRPVAYGWNPLATTGASRALHLFLVLGWIFALLLPFFQR
jgi:hypothetical protein